MRLAEYERGGQGLYAGLADVVATILAAALAQRDDLHPQQIQHRAKDVGSLTRKLARAKAPAEAKIEDFAKDLAGTRVIFYTNADVARFQSASLLRDNFEIDWSRTRFHHPTSQDPAPSELFVSTNYVVRLTPERAALPEYASYAGLWCEVQVQTTLNHAWAEMAHDTLYKKPALNGFGGRLMEGIEARMKAIMRDYLAPAGYAFQKVLSDVERLSRGQALYEQDLAAAIAAAEDINGLYERLQTFQAAVLPHLDDHAGAAADLQATAIAAVERARALPVRAIQTPFGNYAGKTADEVAMIAASILRDLRFLDVEATFQAIRRLFLGATSEGERETWTKLTNDLAKHDLHVWRQAGGFVQALLIEQVLAMTLEERQAARPLVLSVIRHALTTELSGTTGGFDTFTLHNGSVSADDDLAAVRRKAIDLLIAFDTPEISVAERGELMAIFSTAMTLPTPSRPRDPNLAALVYADAARILGHFGQRWPAWTFEQRQTFEDRLLWRYRHHGRAPLDAADGAGLAAARAAMVEAIFALRDAMNQDQDFVTYKLLVGFESVFPPAWEDPEFDHEHGEAYRQAQTPALIETIGPDTQVAWRATLMRCAATDSQDMATFPSFIAFLELLARRKPDVVLWLLASLQPPLTRFLTAMLHGLSETERWPQAVELIEAWVADRHLLDDLAFASGTVTAITPERFKTIVEAALEAKDASAAVNAIRAIAWREDGGGEAGKALFLRIIAFMAEQDNSHWWVNGWLSRHDVSALLAALTEQEVRQVLATLVTYPAINHSLEIFLTEMAASHPQAVLDYLGLRMAHRRAHRGGDRYEDIPYHASRLAKALLGSAKALVTAGRGWFDNDDRGLFTYHGGRLITLVFPSFGPVLEEALLAYVEADEPGDLDYVIDVLDAYHGEAFLQPVAKALVAKLPAGDERLPHIEGALEPSGVTSGEFGRVNRLKRHRDTILAWAEDPNEAVRVFAAGYAHDLDNRIKAEQRQSEESLAMRRIEWDLPPLAEAPDDEDEAEEA